jgi:hypothetical protein
MSRARERLLALSATVLLPVALRWLSLSTVLGICDRWPAMEQPRHPPHALAHRVRRWLSRGRGPWSSTCLTRSLVLYAMLRQHGYRPRFVIGVAGGEARFDAHAWITLGDSSIGDARGATDRYTELLTHRA